MGKYLLIIVSIVTLTFGCRSARTAQEPVQAQQPEATPVIVEQKVEVAPPVAAKVNYYSPETFLIGYFQPDLLQKPPHNAWYLKEYEKYEPNEEFTQKIAGTNVGNVSVLIVLGSWCGDSHREVPRFIKMIDQCGLTKINVTFLGVDMSKQSPVGDYDKLGIKKVPTFIVYRNKVEIGRIIEYPSTSLEQDMLEILSKEIK